MTEEEITNYLEKVSNERTIIPLADYIQGLLDLYKEQEKEIYNIKQLTTYLDACIMTDEILDEFKLKKINDYNFILAGKQYFDKGYFKETFISKNKIREKIEKLEKEKNMYFEKQIIQGKIDLLKELLEE